MSTRILAMLGLCGVALATVLAFIASLVMSP